MELERFLLFEHLIFQIGKSNLIQNKVCQKRYI